MTDLMLKKLKILQQYSFNPSNFQKLIDLLEDMIHIDAFKRPDPLSALIRFSWGLQNYLILDYS